MKNIYFILTVLFFGLFKAQLDTVHYLQPLVFNNYVAETVTEEYIYLSTPSPTPITVNIRRANGTTIPRFNCVELISGGSTTNVTNGQITISNSVPVRLQFINANNAVIDPGANNNPITLPATKAGTIIAENEGGLIFTSTEPFFVNYRMRSDAQAASVLTKGKGALGKNFRWGGTHIQYTTTITDIGNMLSVMATEDNTQVTISNIKSGTQFLNGSNSTPITSTTINRTLQKGQSFILYAPVKNNQRSTQDAGWLGAKVTATKDIVATVGGLMQMGDNSTANATSTTNRDMAVDQLVPVEELGTEYVVMQGNGGNYEKVIVIANENNTTITLNNNTTPSYTVADAGGYVVIPGNNFQNKNMFIKTNKAVYVFHKIYGASALNTNSFMFIPPLSCFGQKEVDLIPAPNRIGDTSYSNTELAILSAGGLEPEVLKNGNPLTPSSSGVAVPGNPNWKTFRYNIGDFTQYDKLKIFSAGTIQAELIGASGAAGFGGYFSGFGTKPIVFIEVLNSPTDRPCTGDTGNSDLDLSTAAGLGTYQWYKNNDPIPGATNYTYSIPAIDDTPAEYSVKVTAPGGCVIFSNVVKSYACPCYKPGSTGTPEPTKFGISTKQTPSVDNWPTSVNNGFIALDSSNKGMVITRIEDPEGSIEEPIEGMIVYDINDSCLKLYSKGQWKCVTQTCN